VHTRYITGDCDTDKSREEWMHIPSLLRKYREWYPQPLVFTFLKNITYFLQFCKFSKDNENIGWLFWNSPSILQGQTYSKFVLRSKDYRHNGAKTQLITKIIVNSGKRYTWQRWTAVTNVLSIALIVSKLHSFSKQFPSLINFSLYFANL